MLDGPMRPSGPRNGIAQVNDWRRYQPARTRARTPSRRRRPASGILGCTEAPTQPPARPPIPAASPRLQSGAIEPSAYDEMTAYVATPTNEGTQVLASAAGAARETAIPVPTRIGPSTEP